MTYRPLLIGFVICSLGLMLTGCGGKTTSSEPGTVLDEAKRAGRTAESFPAADEDYFREMDKGVRLTPDEVKGRNMWLVWTGGNDRLWDYLASHSFGALDFLKTLSSHPSMKHVSRDNRWQYLGVVNEPCFEKATGPRADRYGLWFDTRRQDCPPRAVRKRAKISWRENRRTR